MEMVGLKSGMRIDRFDRFGKALRVIREGSGDLEAEVFSSLQKLSGIVPMLRCRFMGHEDAVMFILDHHHTVVCAQRVVAVNMTLRRRGKGQQLPQHLLWRGQMRANVINPSCDRRLGNGNQEQAGKDQRNLSETDSADHRKGAGQPDDACAHRLGGRDTLDVRCTGHALVLSVQGVAWRDDTPILYRIVERRECMNIDVGGLLAPTDRRGRPQRTLQVVFAQIELHNGRAIFDRRADKGVLVYFRDNRLKRHLHSYSHPTPFAPTDLPLDTLRRGEQHGVIMAKWPDLSAKNKTDIPPKKAGLQAASEGG